MKRIALVTYLVCTFLFSSAQKKINEGIITYEVEYNLPQNMQQYAAMFPKVMAIYFKGDSSVMKAESQMSTTTNIMNSKTEYEKDPGKHSYDGQKVLSYTKTRGL